MLPCQRPHLFDLYLEKWMNRSHNMDWELSNWKESKYNQNEIIKIQRTFPVHTNCYRTLLQPITLRERRKIIHNYITMTWKEMANGEKRNTPRQQWRIAQCSFFKRAFRIPGLGGEVIILTMELGLDGCQVWYWCMPIMLEQSPPLELGSRAPSCCSLSQNPIALRTYESSCSSKGVLHLIIWNKKSVKERMWGVCRGSMPQSLEKIR